MIGMMRVRRVVRLPASVLGAAHSRTLGGYVYTQQLYGRRFFASSPGEKPKPDGTGGQQQQQQQHNTGGSSSKGGADRPPAASGGGPGMQKHEKVYKSFQEAQAAADDFGPAYPQVPPQGPARPYIVQPVTAPGKSRTPFGRYLDLAKPHLPMIIGSAFCVAAYSGFTLAIPHGFGQLLDSACKGEIPVDTAIRLIGMFVGAAAANFGRLMLVGYAGERIVARLRGMLFNGIMQQRASFFDEKVNRTGALAQRLTMDTNVVGSALTEAMCNGTKNICQVVGSLGIMLYFSPQLTGLVFVLIPPVAIYTGTYGKYVRKLSMEKQDALAEKGTVCEERLSQIRTVKAFATEHQESNWYQKKVERVVSVGLRMVKFNAGYVATIHLFGYGVLYCLLWGGSLLIAGRDISAGTLFSFILYTIYCGIGFTGLTQFISDFNKGFGASLRMFKMIDEADKYQDELKKFEGKLIPDVRGHVVFDEVTFRYPTRPEAVIYDNITFEAQPGQCTAIVGSSGSGKSTVTSLLMQLYDVESGQVRIDGTDIATVDRSWLRSIIGYVPQEPVLFGGTIAQNIAYGLSSRTVWDQPIDKWTMSAVIDAAQGANAHDFIMSLPEQYDTYVGEAGKSLSGGQKQRIAIARALIRKPTILLLDEATSALDSESEAVVQQAIDKLIVDARTEKKRSVIVIAHRLSMIKEADQVVVMGGGKILCTGDFDTVSENPAFQQLVGTASTPTTPRKGQSDSEE